MLQDGQVNNYDYVGYPLTGAHTKLRIHDRIQSTVSSAGSAEMFMEENHCGSRIICCGVYCGRHTVDAAAADSYVKWFTFLIFAGAVLLFPRMSRDTLLQSLYNISLQMFVHTLQLVAGIGIAEAVFHANPWAEIVSMCLYLAVSVWLYLRLFRRPYRELATALRDRWRSFSIVSVIGSVFLITYWTRPAFLMARSASDQLLYLGIWGLFLMTHLMMLNNMSALYRELTAEKKVALVEMSNHQLSVQLSLIQDSVEEARRIRHDTRHHNLLITRYAQNGQLHELLQYMGTYNTTGDCVKEPVYCDNLAANNILSVYVRNAERQGIEVRLDVTLEKEIPVQDIDLVAILANLMENAVHGCIQSGKQQPFIELLIGRKASKLVIFIRNTARDGIQFENGIPISGTGGGTGIPSILHSAARYGGEYDIKAEKGLFSCQLLLKI